MITKIIYEKYPLVFEKIYDYFHVKTREVYHCNEDRKKEINRMIINLGDIECLLINKKGIYPFSMLYGLLVDFFDENGFYISIYYYYEREIKIALFAFAISSGKLNSVDAYTEKIYTRHEAQKQAILKAAEIMEERLK